MSARESRRPGLAAMATEYAVRIAGEGRKYGLYLLLASQRPQKLHPNVVSQCDNLVLMRMSSSADLAYLAEVFSQVPGSLLGRAPHFTIGQALIAGPEPHLRHLRRASVPRGRQRHPGDLGDRARPGIGRRLRHAMAEARTTRTREAGAVVLAPVLAHAAVNVSAHLAGRLVVNRQVRSGGGPGGRPRIHPARVKTAHPVAGQPAHAMELLREALSCDD